MATSERSGNDERPRPRRRRRIAALAGVVLCVLLGAAAVVLVVRLRPDRIRADVLSLLESVAPAPAFEAGVRSASFSPLSGLEIGGLSLATSGPRPIELLRVDRARIGIGIGSLLGGGPAVQSVELRGVAVHLVRLHDGAWAHEALLEVLRRSGGEGKNDLPMISLIDGRIVFRDDTAREGLGSFEFDRLEASVSSLDPGRHRGTIAFSIGGRSDLATRFAVDGEWQREPGRLRVERVLAEVDLGTLWNRVPRGEEGVLAGLDVTGKLELLGTLEWSPSDGLGASDLAATVVEGRVGLPSGFEFDSINAVLHHDGRTLTVESFRSLTPAGSCEGGGEIAVGPRDGDAEPTASGLDLRFPRVPVDEPLFATFPEKVKEAVADSGITARGTVAVEISVKGAAFPPDVEDFFVRVEPAGLTVRHERLPAPLTLLDGRVTFTGGEVTLDPPLRGRIDTARVTAEGTLALDSAPEDGDGDAGDSGLAGAIREGSLVVGIHDVAVTPELLDIMPPKTRRVIESLEPVGRGGVELRARWRDGERKPHLAVFVRPAAMKMRYERFPVTVEQVRGEIAVDLDEKTVRLENLTGRYRRQALSANGLFRFGTERPEFSLVLSSPSLSLDRELLAAMPERARGPLVESRAAARGRVEVRVARVEGDEEVVVRVDVDVLDASVQPPGFPVPARLVEGRVEVEGTNVVLRKVRGTGHLEFVIDGEIAEETKGVAVHLRGHVDNLVSDSSLLGFFPEYARERVRRMHLRGTHAFDFEADCMYATAPDVPRRFSYRVTDLRSRDGGMDVGIRLGHVVLAGEFAGEGVLGERHTLQGKARIATLTFNRLQLENADVVFAYGTEHPAIAAAREGRPMAGATHVVDAGFVERLRPDMLRHTLQVLIDRADLYGGMFNGFLYVNLGDLSELRGRFSADGIDITRASRSIHEDDSIDAIGVASGKVRFSGATGDASTLVGEGEVELRGAELSDIPVVSTAVETVAPGRGRDVGFRNLKSRFTIHDGKFHTDGGLVVDGPIMRLRGNGTMDFYGVLNLNFFPEPIDLSRIPLIDLFQRQLAEVQVTGTLDKPSAKLVVLKVPVGLE